MQYQILSNDEVQSGQALVEEVTNTVVFIPHPKQEGESDNAFEERCDADKIEMVMAGIAKVSAGSKIAMAFAVKKYYEGGYFARSTNAKYGDLSNYPAVRLMQIYEMNGVNLAYNSTALSQMNTLLVEIIPFINKFGTKFPQLKPYGGKVPIQVYALPFKDDQTLQSTQVVRDVISFYRRKQENGKPGQDDAQLMLICLMNGNSGPITALMKAATDLEGQQDAADIEKPTVWERLTSAGVEFFTDEMDETVAKLIRSKLKAVCVIKLEVKTPEQHNDDETDSDQIDLPF